MAPPRQKSTVRQLSSPEAAWLGAMVEGEGSICLRGRRPRYIAVYSSEVETVATCLRLAGDGTVIYDGEPSSAIGRKPMWRWHLAKINSLFELLPQLIPYLTSKDGRAEEVLAYANRRD